MAIRVMFEVTRRAGTPLLSSVLGATAEAFGKLVQAPFELQKQYKEQGAVKMEDLQRQGGRVEYLDVNSTDLEPFKEALRENGVYFHIREGIKPETYEVWYSGRDIGQVTNAVDKVLNQSVKENIEAIKEGKTAEELWKGKTEVWKEAAEATKDVAQQTTEAAKEAAQSVAEHAQGLVR